LLIYQRFRFYRLKYVVVLIEHSLVIGLGKSAILFHLFWRYLFWDELFLRLGNYSRQWICPTYGGKSVDEVLLGIEFEAIVFDGFYLSESCALQSLVINMVSVQSRLEIAANIFHAIRYNLLDILVLKLTRSGAIEPVQAVMDSPLYESDRVFFTALLDVMAEKPLHNFGIHFLNERDQVFHALVFSFGRLRQPVEQLQVPHGLQDVNFRVFSLDFSAHPHLHEGDQVVEMCSLGFHHLLHDVPHDAFAPV